jgi:hypothetical protein
MCLVRLFASRIGSPNQNGRSLDWKLACFDFRGGLIELPSDPVANFPGEKNESGDQANRDEHPVLAFETQKGEMLSEKLHRYRPLFVQDKRLSSGNILFLYSAGRTALVREALVGVSLTVFWGVVQRSPETGTQQAKGQLPASGMARWKLRLTIVSEVRG